MKRLIVLLAVIAFGVFASPLSKPVAAGSGPAQWPALLNCSDVNADGSVSIIDIAQVVSHFGTFVVLDSDGTHYVPGPGYMLLYDVSGGGSVDASDISSVVGQFGDLCPLVETQVAAATLAMAGLPPYDSNPDLRNWNEAENDGGYSPETQYVANIGIHASNGNYTPTFDHTSPIGLIYKAGPGGVPDELIGAWYVVPMQDVCDVFLPGQTCSDIEPEGFDGPEDNTDVSTVQRGWHTHQNLCFIPSGPTVVEQGPGGSHEQCKASGGVYNFPVYGWMVHLYNFIPNPDGRFMMWNQPNLP